MDFLLSLPVDAVLNTLVSSAGIVTAMWAIFTWRRQQLYTSARWQNELVNKFYFSEDFHDIRLHFEFDFYHYYAPACERWDTNKDLLTTEDKLRLSELDSVVNFFENLLYIISQGHISERDHFAAFSYWYVLMRDEEHAALRQYLRYGFENIQSRTNMVCPTYYVEPVGREAFSADILSKMGAKRVGTCTIRGQFTSEDGLTAAAGEVPCVYYLIPDSMSFDGLDALFGFHPGDWAASKEVRRYVRTADPMLGGWTYIASADALRFGQRRSGKWVLDRPK
jgi:hypothetical protein